MDLNTHTTIKTAIELGFAHKNKGLNLDLNDQPTKKAKTETDNCNGRQLALTDLSEELKKNIFEYLSQKEFVAMSRVCKEWKILAHQHIRQLDFSKKPNIGKNKVLEGLQGWSLQGSQCKSIILLGSFYVDIEILKFLAEKYSFLNEVQLNKCGAITNADLESLSNLKELKTLDLHGIYGRDSQFTDTGLEALKGLTGLTYLSLNSCSNITDTGLEALRGLTALTSLKLYSCTGFIYEKNGKITDKGLKALKMALPRINIKKW